MELVFKTFISSNSVLLGRIKYIQYKVFVLFSPSGSLLARYCISEMVVFLRNEV
jgi:hypothetical protein